MLFPPLDNENTRDKAKGLRVISERHIGELSVRCLSTLNRGRLYTTVSSCEQGVRALYGRREIFVRTEINFHAHENLTPCERRFYDEASERKRRAKSPV